MAREKILLVDDEKIIHDVFTTAFKEYEIIPVASGKEALHILSRPNEIDLVVSDLMMPGLTGMELLNKIKQINPNLKVVIFTGYNYKEVAIRGLHSYADGYIEKPFDIGKIKEIFKRLLK